MVVETAEDTDRDYELWALMRRTCDAMTRAREDELRAFDLSMIQAATLFAVKTIKGPATPAEISRWLFRQAHSVSGLLDRMEKDGLVRRVKDLEKKNLIRVTLTEKGEKAYQQSRARNSIHGILSCLSEKEREDLRTYMKTLRNRALDELSVRPRTSFP